MGAHRQHYIQSTLRITIVVALSSRNSTLLNKPSKCERNILRLLNDTIVPVPNLGARVTVGYIRPFRFVVFPTFVEPSSIYSSSPLHSALLPQSHIYPLVALYSSCLITKCVIR